MNNKLCSLFVNLSNEKSVLWSKEQKDSALSLVNAEYIGETAIIDIAPPEIKDDYSESDIVKLAEQYIDHICNNIRPKAVLIEHIDPTFIFKVVVGLKLKEIRCCTSVFGWVSNDTLKDTEIDIKDFKFLKFREFIV